MVDPNEKDEPGFDEEDTGLEDFESGDAPEAGQELADAEAEESPVAATDKPQRRQNDYREIARQEAEHRARVEREYAEYRAQAEAQRNQGDEPENVFEQRMSLLPVDQQIRERLSRSDRRHQRELILTRMQAADSADKANYQAKSASNPRYRKYEARVEELLAFERRNGRDFPRETILRFVLGEAVIANEGKTAKARTAGQDRIRQQQVRPPTAGSDQAAQRRRASGGDSVADLERRLEGVFI